MYIRSVKYLAFVKALVGGSEELSVVKQLGIEMAIVTANVM